MGAGKKIITGLNEAVAYARGQRGGALVREVKVPESIDVAAKSALIGGPMAPLTEAKKGSFKEFAEEFQPFEWTRPVKALFVFTDLKSGAEYCECHISAQKLVNLATTDVPLDPDQPDYRANRELVTNHSAFAQMKEDATVGRSFSNIVAEYTKDYDQAHPLKIIGGQHRFQAIKTALEAGVNEYHGVKVYLDLNMDQRLDVQLTQL